MFSDEPSIIVESSRLAFREMTRDDLDFVATMLADPEVMRFYPKCLDRDESIAWIDRQRDRYIRHGYGIWLAVDRTNGAPVGQIGPTPHEIDGTIRPGITYLIHRPRWREGFASEGAAVVRDYVLGVLDKPEVLCLIRPENVPSQGVARKIGLTLKEGLTIELAGFTHLVYAGESGG